MVRRYALRDDPWKKIEDFMALKRIGGSSLLAELAPCFRQDVQAKPEILQIITALQERFKIYRADAFLHSSTEIKLPPAEKIMRTLRVVLA